MSAGLIVDYFAGGGGASEALEIAYGRKVDIAINHDAKALAMHAANHPETQHIQDDVFAVDIAKICNGRPIDVAWFSPDCFPAGTMILTRGGYRAIETVSVGNEVLTHEGRWRPVTAVMSSRKRLVSIKGHGHPGLCVSAEHPILVKRRSSAWNNKLRQYRPHFSEPEWEKPSELDIEAGGEWYWAQPHRLPSGEIPPEIPVRRGRILNIDHRVMWLAGRYVADGWTRLTDTRADLVITCGRHETDALGARLSQWPRHGSRARSNELAWHKRETRTAVQFTAAHRGFVEWLRAHFGHGAADKSVPGWVFGISKELRASFLDGYCSGDGSSVSNAGTDQVQCTTISRSLAFGIKLLACSLGHAVQVYYRANQTDVIEGRKVNASPTWNVRWRPAIAEDHAQTYRDDI